MIVAQLTAVSKRFSASSRAPIISKLTGKHSVRDQKAALPETSFAIEQGEIIRLVGHNGSGKTTLLRILAGILTPTSGTLTLAGPVIPILTPHAYFFDELPLQDSLFFCGACFGLSRREILGSLENFSIPCDMREKSAYLTPGQRMRLLIHMACASKAKLLLLDEVLALLDSPSLDYALNELTKFVSGGSSVVVVAHNSSFPCVTREISLS